VRKIEQEKPEENEIEEFHAGAARAQSRAQPKAQEEMSILDLTEKEMARYEL
jgi:hypothetical protein